MKLRFSEKSVEAQNNFVTKRDEIKLIQATRKGDLGEIKRLMNQVPSPRDLITSTRTRWGVSSLHVAARYGRTDVMEVLLQNGADVNEEVYPHGTALNVACRFSSPQTILLLLRYGAMRDSNPQRNGMILHTIAQHCIVEVAEVIYKKNIHPPVTFSDRVGMTALHKAAQVGNDVMCTWLLAHGADVLAKDARRLTPFILACLQGHISTMKILFAAETTNKLRPRRSLINVDDEGKSALHYAVFEDKIKAVNLLLTWGSNVNLPDGADINAEDNQFVTCLSHACAQGHTDVVKTLLRLGASLTRQMWHEESCLHKAINNGHLDVLYLLLESPACDMTVLGAVNMKTENALHCAAKQKDIRFLQALVKKGCLNRENGGGELPLHVAAMLWPSPGIYRGCSGGFPLIGVRIPKEDPFIIQSTRSDAFITELPGSLKYGKNPWMLYQYSLNSMTFYQLTLFIRLNYLEIFYGSYETVLWLAQLATDVNAECWEGKSPFFCACETGNREAIQALMKFNANVKDADVLFRNTLIVAAIGGFTDIVVDLIKLGLSLNARDVDGNTALHHACIQGHLLTVEALLAHNAPVAVTNVRGQSPLDLAIERSHEEVAISMMKHSSWQESLSVRNRDGLTSIDKMIELTPGAVKTVLDNCVKTSNHSKTDEDFTIEFNFKYIDPGPDDPSAKDGVYNSLLTMVKHSREDLLAHPLCQSNLSYKWRGFGQLSQLIAIVIQGGFMLTLYIFYQAITKPHEEDYMCQPVGYRAENNSNVTYYVSSFFDVSKRPLLKKDYMTHIEAVLHLFMVIIILRELFNLFTLGRRHLHSLQFQLTLLTVFLISLGTVPPGYAPCDMEWRAIAYGMQVLFIMASIFIIRFDRLGLYFTMYFEVVKTMLKVSVMLFFFLVALSIPLDVMMNEDGFKKNEPAILTLLAMTLGELQFRDNFIKGDNTGFTYELYILFAICCIFLNLSLMNLMIGVAVGDITKVEKRAYLTRLRTQITYLIDSEASVPRCVRKWFHTEVLDIRPNSQPKTIMQAFYRRVMYSDQIEFIKKSEEMNTTAENALKLEEEMEDQKQKLANMQKTADQILDRLIHLESRLVADADVERSSSRTGQRDIGANSSFS